VFSNRTAPSAPPVNAGIRNTRSARSVVSRSSRYPFALAAYPGKSARLLVAFAVTGGMPAHSISGNETTLPPPAIELTAPATNAATKRIG
jgi:hypothetical protein